MADWRNNYLPARLKSVLARLVLKISCPVKSQSFAQETPSSLSFHCVYVSHVEVPVCESYEQAQKEEATQNMENRRQANRLV